MASPVMLSIDSGESECRNAGYSRQPGIANHSISQFSIDPYILGPVLAPCLSYVQGNCIANHFYRWSTNAVGDWKRPSLIRWTSEEASSQGDLPLSWDATS